MNRALGVMAITAVLATGCASRGTVRRLQSNLAALRSEVTETRAGQDRAARELAQTRAELEALDARARALGEGVRAAGEEVARFAARLTAAEEEIKKVRTRLEVRSRTAEAPPAAPRAARRREAEDAYAAALAMFRAREYGQAVLDFIDVIGTYRGHPLAANAQYWIGEAYYVQHDYRQALLEFQKVLEMRGGKIPDALVKIGLCQWTLRDARRARATWQRVVHEHPGTEPARIARALLRKHAGRR